MSSGFDGVAGGWIEKQKARETWRSKGKTRIQATLLAATTAPITTPSDYSPYVTEIQRLQSALLAAQTGNYQPGADFGMPVANQATLLSFDRPREFYCWLHGWNNTHHGTTCKIMGANTSYTNAMKAATGPANTGGNPKVGVPVHLHHTRLTFFSPLTSCLSCLSSPLPFSNPTLHTHSTPSPASLGDKAFALPHEATRARPAILATHLLEQAEGPISCPQEDTRARPAITLALLREQSEGHISYPHEDTRASSARQNIASHTMLTKSEGHNSRVRDIVAFFPPLSHYSRGP